MELTTKTFQEKLNQVVPELPEKPAQLVQKIVKLLNTVSTSNHENKFLILGSPDNIKDRKKGLSEYFLELISYLKNTRKSEFKNLKKLILDDHLQIGMILKDLGLKADFESLASHKYLEDIILISLFDFLGLPEKAEDRAKDLLSKIAEVNQNRKL